MAAPLRITSQRGIVQKASTNRQPREDEFKEYLGRLVKMIPAEAIGMYAAGTGVIPPHETLVLGLWAALGLMAVVALRAFATSDKAKGIGPQWPAVALSCVAYLIWLYAQGGLAQQLGIHVPWLGTLLIIAWGVFVPIFYRGEDA